MRLLRLSFFAFGLMVLASCASADSAASSESTSTTSTTTTVSPFIELEGVFRLTEASLNGDPLDLADAPHLDISFAYRPDPASESPYGTISTTDGCNSISGTFTIDDAGRFEVEAESTMMECGDAYLDQTILGVLGGTVNPMGERMQITSGSLVAEFER